MWRVIKLFQWWFQFQDGRKEIYPYMWVGPFRVDWLGTGRYMHISFYPTPE